MSIYLSDRPLSQIKSYNLRSYRINLISMAYIPAYIAPKRGSLLVVLERNMNVLI